MGAKDHKIEQELSAEVVVVRFHPLLHFIGHVVNRNLRTQMEGYNTILHKPPKNKFSALHLKERGEKRKKSVLNSPKPIHVHA